MTDDNDLTERFKELEGNTLEDDWEEDPDPPPEYGKPDPRTIVEMVGEIAWVWNTHNADANIQFEGETVDVAQ